MLSSWWFPGALLAAAGLTAGVARFLIFRQPVSQQIAVVSAQRAFGGQKLNLLLLGYQDDEATTDTIVLAHLDVDPQTAVAIRM